MLGSIGEALVALDGTLAGQRLALVLALSAAFLHAVFGAIQKGRHDPWLARGAIDAAYAFMALPVALFVVPWPGPHMWPVFAGMVAIHGAYKLLQAMAYTRGAYTVVYPVVRGTGPIFAVIGAWLIFGEAFTPLQWLGLAVLVTGIFGLAVYNLIHVQVDRDTLVPALALAVATGAFVALYTTYDAWGIRQADNPFTFLAWFFLLDGLMMPPVALWRARRTGLPRPLWPLALRGVLGGVVALGSFGSIMLATRIGRVGEAAVIRETSTIFAALIGVVVLKETVGPRRLALMALIATGAVIVEAGRR